MVRLAHKTRLLCVALILCAQPVLADTPALSPYGAAMQAELSKRSLRINGVAIDTDTLSSYYAQNPETVLWLKTTWLNRLGLNDRAQDALTLIDGAKAHGLLPSRYPLDTIATLAETPEGSTEERLQKQVALELLTSHTVLQYARDMQYGATGTYDRDASLALFAQVVGAGSPATALASLVPSTPEYSHLQRGLAAYRQIAEKGGWPSFTQGKAIKPGMRDVRVAALRGILVAAGDANASVLQTADGSLYDAALVEGMKHFQLRHSIEADGAIGPKTQAALAVPVERRIAQISATLERIRWIPRGESRYVLVNIPGYYLRAVSNDRVTTQRVIVGTPRTGTPQFSLAITDVTFNPTWGVPTRIAIESILPKVRNNPGYLNDAGFTVVENGGGVVDPHSVDWHSVGRGNFPYALRQAAGRQNALGKIKFAIPNSDSIYLHSTSHPELFAKNERALSNGCVRLEDPRSFAQFVLADEKWQQAQVDATYDSSATKNVRITPMPVHTVYWTSWVDSNNWLHFSPDIYGKDASLIAKLTPASPDKGMQLAAR